MKLIAKNYKKSREESNQNDTNRKKLKIMKTDPKISKLTKLNCKEVIIMVVDLIGR